MKTGGSPLLRRIVRAAGGSLLILVCACTTSPARTPLERASDLRLEGQVEQALQQDERIYARHINVEVKRGVAHLSGFVFDGDDLFEARRASAAVPGVVAVVSELELLVGGRGAAR